MNKVGKIVIVVALIAAVAIVVAVKWNQPGEDTGAGTDAVSLGQVATQQEPAEYKPEQLIGKGLPALIDIGAGTCIPCKMMAPILEELKKEYAGVFSVNFIDIHKNPDQVDKYNIRVIPTQVFFDASGKELFRHEGFFSKQDILAKWAELGVELKKTE